MKQRWSISEVAVETGVPANRISYAIESLKIEGPTERFGTMRVFTPKDVQRIREHFGKKPNKKGTDKRDP